MISSGSHCVATLVYGGGGGGTGICGVRGVGGGPGPGVAQGPPHREWDPNRWAEIPQGDAGTPPREGRDPQDPPLITLTPPLRTPQGSIGTPRESRDPPQDPPSYNTDPPPETP